MKTSLVFLSVLLVSAVAVLSSPAVEQPTDPEITRSLQQAFRRDFRLKNASLEITTLAGSVTLKGRVASFLDKHHAERIAVRTAGVRSVRNLIQVEPHFRPDNEIADDVRQRLAQSSLAQAAEVQVRVDGGVVSLSGQVPTWAESRQAQMTAGEVRGVRLVRNQLAIRGTTTGPLAARTDGQIQADVESELRRDAYLAELPIEVSVRNHVVTLEGEVANLFQRDRAGEEARLIGNVRDVQNRLVVASQLQLQSLPEPPSDEALRQCVLDELDADPRIMASHVEVAVSRRCVTLRGTLATMFEKQAAGRIACRVYGTAGVENLLRVEAPVRRDQEIRDEVRFNLQSDSLLADQPVNVTVKDATVSLTGEVNDFTSKYHATRLAARVRGVRAIDGDLKVRWTEATNDEAVQRAITERLVSNATTRPIADRIRVQVKDGVVTLSGRVDRRSQSLEAERIARRTDGVRAVVSQLVIAVGM
jgi:osmotically-inducible protein OsmY